jgi:hypothetical protein
MELLTTATPFFIVMKLKVGRLKVEGGKVEGLFGKAFPEG